MKVKDLIAILEKENPETECVAYIENDRHSGLASINCVYRAGNCLGIEAKFTNEFVLTDNHIHAWLPEKYIYKKDF